MVVYLIDFPLASNTTSMIPTSTEPITTNVHETTGMKTWKNSLTTHSSNDYNNRIFAEADKTESVESGNKEIMSWSVFAMIVIFLLLLILIVGALLLWVNLKTKRLEKIGLDGIKDEKIQRLRLSRISSIGNASIHQNISADAEGMKALKPARIQLGDMSPSSVNLNNVQMLQQVRSLKSLSSLVVGSSIVMNDIVDEMEAEKDDFAILDSAETPIGDTPGNLEENEHELKRKNIMKGNFEQIPNETPCTDINDDVEYVFGDLTPHGDYLLVKEQKK